MEGDSGQVVGVWQGMLRCNGQVRLINGRGQWPGGKGGGRVGEAGEEYPVIV